MRRFFESLESRRLLTTFWVSTAGNDSGAGTRAVPFKTLQHAADAVRAGDTVDVTAGNYSGFSEFGLKGTAAAHIRFQAIGAVNIINRAAAETQVDCGIELSGFDASSGCSYIDIDGFNVNDAGGTIRNGIASGFRIRFSDHVTVTNCKASNNGWVGFYGAYLNNCVFDGCESFNNNLGTVTPGEHGFYVAQNSHNVTISNCSIHDNFGNGLHLNSDGFIATGFVVTGNQIFRNGKNGGSGLNCDGIQNSTFTGNTIVGNYNKAASFYQIDGAGPSRGNLIAENIMVQGTGNSSLQLHTGPNTVGENVTINDGTGLAIENDGGTQTWIGPLIYRGGLSGVPAGVAKVFSPLGDANFDGRVTGDDYGVVDANLGGSLVADLNHDGIVSGDDFGTIDSHLVGRVLFLIQ